MARNTWKWILEKKGLCDTRKENLGTLFMRMQLLPIRDKDQNIQ